ncbi:MULTISPECIES: hypothetical protein [Rhodomicrobium]|uniref:hypothetical protein n=1 Tax=Rhodomicrobium TaxID=1068 RepID=UPI000F73A9D7|nr:MULTISPECIES: hypothetical protein [Rhodomicrobium]
MAGLSVHRCVNALGITAVLAYAAMAALSYIETPALWDATYSPNATLFFNRIYGVEMVNAIRAWFGGPLAVVITHWVPLVVASVVAVILVFVLGHNGHDEHDEKTARLVLRWAFAITAASFLAFPVFTQDFWLSAVWGNMVDAGVNPYHVKFTPEEIAALPLDHFPMTMSYGPIWALISGVVMTLSGGSLLVTFILFKAVLAGTWGASLVLVDKIMALTAPAMRPMALAVVGWVPLGVLQTVGEGHNDIVMAMPALLWILLLVQKKTLAPVALAFSALAKYTTAPLFLIDVMHNLRSHRVPLRAYAPRLILPALITIAVMAIFYRSTAFFDGVRLINEWHFLQPSDAFAALDDAFGGWLAPFGEIANIVFPAIALHQCYIYWNKPDNEEMLRATLAVMAAVSFSAISHLWPWYLVWTLPLAALVPGWWLSRFVIGLALLAPFTVVVWWVPEVEDFKHVAALVMYIVAALWTMLTAPKPEEQVEDLANVVRNVDFTRARNEAAARLQEAEYPTEVRVKVKAVVPGE